MVNKYKRKTSQASWAPSTMQQAMREVQELGRPVKSVATKFGIPRTTLQRHLKSGSSEVKLGRYVTIFSAQQETELLEYVFHMDNLFYGLSKQEFLELVYNYAEMNKIPHPFKNGTAGLDWYKGFIKRHRNLTLRKPEPTSIARARGFNKPQVYRFFDLLEEQIEKHKIDATRLYNMDETGVQTSSNKPPRVLTKSGKRQVGLIASTERGRTTTVICCCNAAGSFIPPFMIFARKRMVPRLLDGAPPGAQAACSDNGWINGPVFLEWLRFFIEIVRPTPDKKVILVLDNHESHKYLLALEYASKNHVIFVSLAPHTTHRIQPLDYCVYGPLKIYFEQAVAVFQKAHAGRIINQNDIAKLFADAYVKAATTNNAINGFKTTGLFPTNRFIFDEADFLPASVTENLLNPTEYENQIETSLPLEEEATKTPSPSILEDTVNNYSVFPAENIEKDHVTPPPAPNAENDSDITPSPSEIEQIYQNQYNQTGVVSENTTQNVPISELDPAGFHEAATGKSITPITSGMENMNPSTDNLASCSTHVTPMVIRPVPKVAPNKTSRRRRAQKAEILTSTPIKDEQRIKIDKKKKISTIKKGHKNVKTVKRNIKEELSAEKPKSKKMKPKSSKASSSVCNSVQYHCFTCQEPYEDPPVEDWIKCNDCNAWAHESCTAYLGIGSFYCDMCQEI